jgi:hypothetical protein
MQLAGARRPEALACVVQVPQIEVGDLGTLEDDDPEQLSGPHRPRAAGANRDDEALDQRAALGLGGQPPVEGPVDVERPAGRGQVRGLWG